MRDARVINIEGGRQMDFAVTQQDANVTAALPAPMFTASSKMSGLTTHRYSRSLETGTENKVGSSLDCYGDDVVENFNDESGAAPFNPSLHYLITRARRGVGPRGSCSAHTSPVECQRRQVNLKKLQQRRFHIAWAFKELEAYEKMWGAEDADSNFPSADNENKSNEEHQDYQLKADEDDGQQVITPSVASSVSTFSTTPSSSFNSANLHQAPRNSGAGMHHCNASIKGPLRTLSLPDPSTLSDRRVLFAVSRKMCSRSTLESFESHGKRSCASAPSVIVNPEEGEGVCTNGDAREFIDTAAWMIEQHETAAACHDNTGAITSEDDGDGCEVSVIMSLDDRDYCDTEDDDASLSDDDDYNRSSSGDSPFSPCDDRRRQRTGVQEDADSIAFSVDSVNVRKRQFDGPRNSVSEKEEIGNGEQRSHNEDHHEHQPMFEFDMTSVEGDLIRTRRYQFQQEPKEQDEVCDHNDDSSLASMSSLNTALTERVMQLELVEESH